MRCCGKLAQYLSQVLGALLLALHLAAAWTSSATRCALLGVLYNIYILWPFVGGGSPYSFISHLVCMGWAPYLSLTGPLLLTTIFVAFGIFHLTPLLDNAPLGVIGLCLCNFVILWHSGFWASLQAHIRVLTVWSQLGPKSESRSEGGPSAP